MWRLLTASEHSAPCLTLFSQTYKHPSKLGTLAGMPTDGHFAPVRQNRKRRSMTPPLAAAGGRGLCQKAAFSDHSAPPLGILGAITMELCFSLDHVCLTSAVLLSLEVRCLSPYFNPLQAKQQRTSSFRLLLALREKTFCRQLTLPGLGWVILYLCSPQCTLEQHCDPLPAKPVIHPSLQRMAEIGFVSSAAVGLEDKYKIL